MSETKYNCRFLRDTEAHETESGAGFQEGDTVKLGAASVARWVRRGAIEAPEGFDVSVLDDVIAPPVPGASAVQPEAAAPADTETADDGGDDEDLSGLTVPELHEMAEARGVDIPSGARKAEIVALLSGSVDAE